MTSIGAAAVAAAYYVRRGASRAVQSPRKKSSLQRQDEEEAGPPVATPTAPIVLPSLLAPTPRRAGVSRILCLHGYGQNAAFFNKKTGSLRKACKSLADFVYLDAPFPATGHSVGDTVDPERGVPLGWWHWDTEAASRAATTKRYLGMEESWQRIRACIDEHGPFDGVLGFSQGAAMASYLCSGAHRKSLSQNAEGPESEPFAFAIFISGFVGNDPTYASLLEDAAPISVPSLHVYGLADERVPQETSRRLASAFSAPEHHPWEGGHAVPSGAPFRNALKAFIAAHAPHAQGTLKGLQPEGSAKDATAGIGQRAREMQPQEIAAREGFSDSERCVSSFVSWSTIREMKYPACDASGSTTFTPNSSLAIRQQQTWQQHQGRGDRASIGTAAGPSPPTAAQQVLGLLAAFPHEGERCAAAYSSWTAIREGSSQWAH